jgi:hypothetical protein
VHSSLRLLPFAVAFALAAMPRASAQSAPAPSASVTYVDGEPRLWQLGTDLVLKHDAMSSFELISLNARNAPARTVDYNSLRFATYQSDEVGGFLERLIFVPQKQHILKLSWTGTPNFIASFKINDNDICAQVRTMEMRWGRHVVRANPLASMYCPEAPQQPFDVDSAQSEATLCRIEHERMAWSNLRPEVPSRSSQLQPDQGDDHRCDNDREHGVVSEWDCRHG